MADLATKLSKLKVTLQKWYKELEEYKAWALANDGVIDASEQAEIDRRTEDITIISMRIAEIERKKGIAKDVKGPDHLISEVDSIKKDLDEIKALLENN